MIELIAMDLDGTLEDSRQDMVNAVHRVRSTLGLDRRSDDAIRPHVNRGMPHLYATCFDDYLAAGGDADALTTQYTAAYTDKIAEHTRLYSGMAEALVALRALAPLAIVTNKPEGLSRSVLAALGVDHLFTTIVGGDTCAEAKPTATPLLFAMAAAGANAGSTVMIGDSPGDIACARAAGTKVVWCRFGYKDEPGDVAPDAIADSASELPTIVKKLMD